MSEVPSIANFFYLLKKEDTDKYELLINTIQDLLPDIEYINPIEIDLKEKSSGKKSKFIPFVLPEKVYDIRVKIKTNNQETSVKNLSTGSRRIFYVLASALISDMSDNKLLCFEELENSIHPALLQRLLMLIAELTPNTKVLITSHSPHLVKYLSLDDILIGIPNCEGLASFKRIKKSKQKKLISYAKDAETNIGDFVFDMLIEGFEDSSFWNDFI
jgi:predicted ATP-dependent endonuclease of OLD family